MFYGDNMTIAEPFGVELIDSPEMRQAIAEWDAVSRGEPYWLDPEDDITASVNAAKVISDKRAALITLDIGIAIDGKDERAKRLQKLADDLLKHLPEQVSEATRLGGIMIKYNGDGWDYFLPGDFGVTALDANGKIVGAIFASYVSHAAEEYYTRLEYHRFEDGVYTVSNKVYKSSEPPGRDNRLLGREVQLSTVPEWSELQPEIAIRDVEEPLFAYFRIPGANTLEPHSPYGMSVFANALPELEAIDVTAARMRGEMRDSKHMTFVGQTITRNAENKGIVLPRFIVGLGMGLNDSETSAIHEHVPTLLTAQRLQDINFNLSLAGVKCGFAPGMFVLDGQPGVITATQVEANDRDTVQTIKGDRDALQTAIDRALKGAAVFLDLYDESGARGAAEWEATYKFGDITYNYEEDRAAWQAYAMRGWIPAWMYLSKFEGMSEDEAKKTVREAQQAQVEAAQMMQMIGVMTGGGYPTEGESDAE